MRFTQYSYVTIDVDPVNAIPYVCAAPPGILNTEDLPHILPRGPRRAEP